MYTALLGFPDELKRGLRIISLPEAQETADVPCDTGIDLDALNKEFDGVPVDLSLVHEGWNSKTGKWAPDSQAIVARAKEVRQWLKARPEKEVVLVTHGGFLHFLTEDWDDYNKLAGKYHMANSLRYSISLHWILISSCRDRNWLVEY